MQIEKLIVKKSYIDYADLPAGNIAYKIMIGMKEKIDVENYVAWY